MQRLHVDTMQKSTVVLSIAGFDPSSGAGITADLKTFAAHGLYGITCPTLLTVQSTKGVFGVTPLAPDQISRTLRCLSEDTPPAGVKIGAMGSAGGLAAVVEWLGDALKANPALPIVIDPVLLSTSGATLLERDALPAFRETLLPLATAVTPNVPEAALLAELYTGIDVLTLAKGVRKHMPRGAVIITGGHLEQAPDDYLLLPGDGEGRWFRGEWVQTPSTHGTGCAFSSALLCGLVQGQTMPQAVAAAKEYVRGALAASQPIGSGRGPLHHLFRLRAEL